MSMTDIVDRLHEQALMKLSEAWRRQDGGQDLCIGAQLAEDAADEIERLRAQLAKANDPTRDATSSDLDIDPIKGD